MSMGQLRLIIRGLDRVAGRVIKKIVLDATANLIESTPVNTGWARANWVPSIGVPFEGTAGADDDISSHDQQDGIAKVVTGYSLGDGPVFITNNVPYIGALNDGSSSQAPSGFVQIAIKKAVTEDILGL